MTDRLSVMIEGGVADVRLDRPDKLNALDPAMFAGIAEVAARLTDDTAVRAVVLSGAGRGFCAGLDMASMATVGGSGDIVARTHGRSNIWQHAAMAWADLPQPVVAAVHGVCLGGGLQVASGADIVLVAPDARLAVFEVNWGLVPDMGGFVRWRGRVRADVLAELALTGRDVTGEEAARLGLATRVAADPLADALALARDIATKSPDAGARHQAAAGGPADAGRRRAVAGGKRGAARGDRRGQPARGGGGADGQARGGVRVSLLPQANSGRDGYSSTIAPSSAARKSSGNLRAPSAPVNTSVASHRATQTPAWNAPAKIVQLDRPTRPTPLTTAMAAGKCASAR